MSEVEAEQRKARVWWQRFIEGAALLAIPPTLAYAFGVVTLWVQLSDVYWFRSDAWTLWYAATIAYKPMAAGLGLGIFFRAFTFTMLFGGALLLAMYLWLRLLKRRRDEHLSGLMLLTIPLTCITLGMLLLILGFGDSTPLTGSILRVVGVPVLLYLFAFYFLFFLDSEGRFIVKRLFAYYPKILYRFIPLLGIVLVVIFMGFPGELQLPCLTRYIPDGEEFDGEVLTPERAQELGFVPFTWGSGLSSEEDLTSEKDENLEYKKTEGRLVTNADGYWWVFDENGRFTAIPRDNEGRLTVEEPSFGGALSRSDSNYEGRFKYDPSNPVRQC